MKNKGFKVILNNFIFLEDTAKSFAKICKINALSLDTINEMINVIYIKSNEKGLQEFKTISNDLLDELKKTLKNRAKEMKSKSVSIEYLSVAISVIKKRFN